MKTTAFVARLSEQVTEIAFRLADLEASEAWERQAAAKVLPRMIRRVRATIDHMVDDAPDGFDDSLQQVIDSIDQADETVRNYNDGKPTRGFATSESSTLLRSLGFIAGYRVKEVQNGEPTDKGVSLRDVGAAMEFIDDQLTDFIRRFVDSKKVKSESLGKCPKDRRAKLYRLSEILRDLDSFTSLNSVETRRIRRHLESVERYPAR